MDNNEEAKAIMDGIESGEIADFTKVDWDNIKTFDTGGYTGEFNDAKLAFLHEKELVLNQEDTENILAAVTAIRSIGADVFA
jgi:hypothetical protein